LGQTDVDAMLEGISSRAWSEWQVYWHLYGFGERRMDVRFAQLMALIANLVRGKDSPAVSIDDILPDEDGDGDGDEYDESSLESSGIVDEDQLIFEATLREALGDEGP
jgi:hypothetical protein